MGIQLLTPDINKSHDIFVIEDKGIRVGLKALRNLGKMSLPILSEREAHGEFKDIFDYVNRSIDDINKKVLESLIYSGALDGFANSRKSKINSVESIIEYIKYIKKGQFPEIPYTLPALDEVYQKMGQLTFEDEPEFETEYLLDKEYEFTGMYISGHPLDIYSDLLATKGIVNTEDIVPEEDETTGERDVSPYDEQVIEVAGIVRDLKPIVTKKGDKMYMLSIEDKTSSIKCVVFPNVAKRLAEILEEKALLLVTGKVQDNDRGCQIVVDDAKELNTLDITATKKVYIDCRTLNKPEKSLVDFINANPGQTEVLIKLKCGWVISKSKINLDWTNYKKLKESYAIELK